MVLPEIHSCIVPPAVVQRAFRANATLPLIAEAPERRTIAPASGAAKVEVAPVKAATAIIILVSFMV